MTRKNFILQDLLNYLWSEQSDIIDQYIDGNTEIGWDDEEYDEEVNAMKLVIEDVERLLEGQMDGTA